MSIHEFFISVFPYIKFTQKNLSIGLSDAEPEPVEPILFGDLEPDKSFL